MALLAAFKLLLFRASGERDISVGVPVANRPDSRLEGVVGVASGRLGDVLERRFVGARGLGPVRLGPVGVVCVRLTHIRR